MRRSAFDGITLLGSSLLLVACGTPFSNRLSEMDWSGPAVPGTIAVSQPKMYQRASLINERRLEEEWIDQQLEASKTIEFKSEIIREVEQITTFAGALGLSFDPASALNYKRATETGAIQQQMDVMKLQLQLDQLKRDAELVRNAFASQSTPVNSDLGRVGTGSAAPAISTANAPAADQLNAAIARLNTALTTRLDAEAKPPATATTTSNPADVFRDRSAYRELLKAARNAASLDDLHDFGGGALIRLNFQAMVLPDRLNPRAPGVVQMTLKAPVLTASDRERIYQGWIEHINQNLNILTDAGWEPNFSFLASAAADNFDVVEYRYELTSASTPAVFAARKVKGKAPVAPVKPVAAPAPMTGLAPADCPGLVLATLANNDKCGTLTFAIPKLAGSAPQEEGYATIQTYLSWFDHHHSDDEDKKKYINLRTLLAENAPAVVSACKLHVPPSTMSDGQQNKAYKLYDGVKEAQIRVATGDALARIERAAQRTLLLHKIKAPRPGILNQLINTRAARARQFLAAFQKLAFDKCTTDQVREFQESTPRLYVPPGFDTALSGDERVAVYEIGPREQVQQVSSVSRVANNFALAVALAGSAPSSGVGARAASDYSRQATGKAATIERVPGLIGYSQSNKTFGWVIGPKATFDPKGNIQLEQTPRALDLSVDLSVPSWWPWFSIETVTGWTPDARSITNGSIEGNDIQGKNKTNVRVPMAPNYADYDVLSARIKLGGLNENRQVSLDDEELRGQAVSACRSTNIFIRGSNIWRATSVLVGGYRLDESAITVAPDMSGILLAVPALDELLGDVMGAKVPVSVFTRYQEANGKIDYAPKPVPGGCKLEEKKPAADGPVITSVVPLQFQAGTELWFTVQGTKLNQYNRVTINGQPGEVNAEKDGKRLLAKFTAAQTSSLPVSRTITLSFFKDNEKLGEKLVEVTANRGAK